MFGQFVTTTQFFIYGKRNFTRTGWEKHRALYAEPDFVTRMDLSNRVFLVTGANSGLGRELCDILAARGATLYMVCRNAERGQAALAGVQEKASDAKAVRLLLGDMSLRADVQRVAEELAAREEHLDGLVCNAGALLNTRSLTRDGVETTLACHLLFGTYYLSKQCEPLLRKSADPRVVVVSSGGMYNTKFPDWSTVSTMKGKYDGTLAYAYCKRGQVLLCEEWSKAEQARPADAAGSAIKFASAHPGWTDTPGVDQAFGSTKSYLEPMRSLFQGVEGIAWLLGVAGGDIEGGAFYLDREPQRKHLAGVFFSEGSRTRNSSEEVAEMMRRLESWSSLDEAGRQAAEERELAAWREEQKFSIAKGARYPPLRCVDYVDLDAFMGKWYVIAAIPTRFERGAFNAVETYRRVDQTHIEVDFRFNYGAADGPEQNIPQRAFVHDTRSGSEWRIQPFFPVKLPYLIIEHQAPAPAADGEGGAEFCVIGYPSRAYVWIMARQPALKPSLFDEIKRRLRDVHFYQDLDERLVIIHQDDAAARAPRDAADGSSV